MAVSVLSAVCNKQKAKMNFEQTWRWFGPNDSISLEEIKQTGATGIVTALHQIPVGEVWSTEAILHRKKIIEKVGLTWSVVESVPVHENIKKRKGNYKQLIENYKQTIVNLGKCRVDLVCYNFMPILDWSRTDLDVVYKDGSITSKFEARAFAAFDLFILRRDNAEKDYTEERIKQAEEYFNNLSEKQKQTLQSTVLFGLPGSLQSYTLDEVKLAIKEYAAIVDLELRENLYYFIKQITPTAEEAGIYLVIHADDPPWPLLGLPRVVSNKNDVELLLNAYNSPHNGLTLCTGSFGADTSNDLVEMAKSFGCRINFMHLRNVWRNESRDFIEENHLEGDIDLYSVMRELILAQEKRITDGRKDFRMPYRPDHGHLMIPDMKREGIYPGYSLFGRMRGLAELRGMELAIRRELKL
ncbi:MAG: mannonate dehydratase [Ignavibacteria bacterium]|nr:MAG: mannonate dehydratase [Ignavibacteria bacterium]KAF0160870.1 MAG: mannonate dehydratase [Ignavibacteria bacterium]